MQNTEWSDNQADLPGTLVGLLIEQAEASPDHTAFVVDDTKVTYAELLSDTRQLAAGLLDKGVTAGDRVGIWMDNSVEWLVTYFAVTGVGATLVPVNTRFRERELATLMSWGLDALIAGPGIASAPFPELIRRVLDSPGDLPIKRPELLVFAGEGDEDGFTTFTDLFYTSDPGTWGAEAEQVALIQSTSGTTGYPKGVLLRHGQMLGTAWHVGERLKIGSESIVCSPAPLYHVFGSDLSVLAPLLRGVPGILFSHFDAGAVLDAIECHRATTLFGLETIIAELIAAQRQRPRDISSLRTGLMAGSPELVQEAHDVLGIEGIVCGYGMSETAATAACGDSDEPLDVRKTTIGMPLPNTAISVVDEDTGQDCAFGEFGEIRIRGWNIASEYVQVRGEITPVVDSEGWLHTGDLGVVDADGRLSFWGRASEVIRIGGENVSPAEIESVLQSHPAVKQAFAVAVPDEHLQQVAVAFVEPLSGQTLDPDELCKLCTESIAPFKVPRQIVLVDVWPQTGTGRVVRSELARSFLND